MIVITIVISILFPILIFSTITYYTIYFLNSIDDCCYDFATYKTFKKQLTKNMELAESNNHYLTTWDDTTLLTTSSKLYSPCTDGKYIRLNDNMIRFYDNKYMVLDIFSYYRYLIWKHNHICQINKTRGIGRIRGLFD